MTFIHVSEVVRRIRGSSIDEVYRGILAWLSKEKASIEKQDEPRYIQAKHGSYQLMGGRPRNAKKKIKISLFQRDDYIVFHMAIDAIYWWYRYYAHWDRYWGELVDELFADLGVKTESASAQDLHHSFLFERDRAHAFWRIMVGAFLLVSGFVLSVIWMVLFSGQEINEILAIMGVFVMLFGALVLWGGFKVTKILKGIEQGKMPSGIVWAA